MEGLLIECEEHVLIAVPRGEITATLAAAAVMCAVRANGQKGIVVPVDPNTYPLELFVAEEAFRQKHPDLKEPLLAHALFIEPTPITESLQDFLIRLSVGKVALASILEWSVDIPAATKRLAHSKDFYVYALAEEYVINNFAKVTDPVLYFAAAADYYRECGDLDTYPEADALRYLYSQSEEPDLVIAAVEKLAAGESVLDLVSK